MENKKYSLEEANKIFEMDANGAYVRLIIPANEPYDVKENENELNLIGKLPQNYTMNEMIRMKKYVAYVYGQIDKSEVCKETGEYGFKTFLQLVKRKKDESVFIIVLENGFVYIESIINGVESHNNSKFDFIDYLRLELESVFPVMKECCDDIDDKSYKISYKDCVFYSYDLYLDLYMMIKNNEPRLLFSILKKQSQVKKNKIESKKIKELDKLESEKSEIDISDVSGGNISDVRNIIEFKLSQNSSFSLGQSRFFSNVIDIADSVDIPESLEFVGQINLSEFKDYSDYNLLPEKGMLYFFQSPLEVNGHIYINGKVIFSEDMNLIRKEANIPKDLTFNYSINDIQSKIEKFSMRYKKDNDNIYYDPFDGENINKIYGFYTDCQMNDIDIKKVSSKYVVLLQLGTDIYGEGVTTYLIEEDDLKNKNFNNVIYMYVQS